MSKALVKRSGGGGGHREGSSGIVPALGSALVPGLGQLMNGETDKALGVFVVSVVAGAGFLGAIPILGSVAAAIAGVTWIYGVADAYVQARKR